MAVLELRRKQRLRRREVERYSEGMKERLGAAPFSPDENVDMAEAKDIHVLLVNNVILAIEVGGNAFPSVRGLLNSKPGKMHVTVDMGAVPFVCKGADVMNPGIVDADRDIEQGDLVWVRDEKHGQPLAVGEAMISGEEMVKAESGKGVRNIHFVGDEIWRYGED